MSDTAEQPTREAEMGASQHFAPAIRVDGVTVTPKGYAWVLAFALAGCDWAIKEASKPEFLPAVRTSLKRDVVVKLEAEISRYELRISKLKEDIASYT